MTECLPAPRVGFVSLGCAKALVDSERLLTQLQAEGYRIVSSYADADMVIVNTCGFIEAAVAESLEVIAEALRENGRVIVTGCLSGARGHLVREIHPKVLAVTGPNAPHEVMDAVHRYLPSPNSPFLNLVPPQGIKLTPPHYAYLKIAEGCNHRCTFCIIPSLRGKHRSRPLPDIMEEAECLVGAGVKELLVISQDTSAYGMDLRYRPEVWKGQVAPSHIATLTRLLGALGIWVRLNYVYPYPHVDQLLPLMAEGVLLPYLDIPFQHASPRILKAMRRPARETSLERIRSWRRICPNITVRSTFIVGFPGETEDDFRYLLEFLEAAELDRVGCFVYSPVEGAAANGLAAPVPDELKAERYERLMLAQAAISARKLRQKVGQYATVIVDEVNAGQAIARSSGEAPEIDGVIFIEGELGMAPGDFAQVRITASSEHDLWARLA